jgi:hypothetical protein
MAFLLPSFILSGFIFPREVMLGLYGAAILALAVSWFRKRLD